MPLLGEMEAVRTTKERALAPSEPAELLAQTLVAPEGKIERPREAKRISSRIAFKGGAKPPAFPSDARQSVKLGAAGIAALDIIKPAP